MISPEAEPADEHDGPIAATKDGKPVMHGLGPRAKHGALGDILSAGGIIAGLGLLALAALVGFDTARMQVPPTYAKVGPQVFPYLASAALAAAGVFFIAESALRKPTALRPDAADADWHALAAISVGFLAQILLIERIGFILSSACLFLAVAWGFGSRRTMRDGAIAVILSAAVYLMFTRLLNLPLPAGPFTGFQ